MTGTTISPCSIAGCCHLANSIAWSQEILPLVICSITKFRNQFSDYPGTRNHFQIPSDLSTAWPLSRQYEIPWQFSGGLRHSSAARGILSVTHIMPVLVLNTCMDANMQFTINSYRELFRDNIFSLIFNKIPDISLTAVKFPDISRFPDKWSPSK